MRQTIQAVLLLTALVLSAQSAYAHVPAGIAVSITPVKSSYLAKDELKISVQYTNVTQSNIRFLKRNTAMEGEINEDFLQINFQGAPLPYIGRHAKRLPPTEDEFITITPGQTVGATVDLAIAYPIYEQGSYELNYRNAAQANKSVEATVLQLSEERPVPQLKRPPIIDASCNATQRAQIDQALGIAETISIRARDALNNAPVQLRPTARRYTEWFGAYSAQRYSTAQTAFNRIASALISQPIGFDCTCDINGRENVFAFVFANDHYNMNVCPVFFRVGPSGTDSRSGTIVHEISHFTVVIGSDDFQSALNQSGSRALARNNPSAAIRNANAFEYFAENTPFLPMPTVNDLADPADLSVTSINVAKEILALGETSTVSASILNSGESTSASTSVTVRLSSDAQITTSDSQVGQGSLNSIQLDSSTGFVSSFQAPNQEGNFWVGICVTPPSGETITNNNCSAGVPITVGSPDLTVDQVNVAEQNPTVEDPTDVFATFVNSGEIASAASTITVRLSTDEQITFDDEEIANDTLRSLQASESLDFQIEIQAPSEGGEFWIGVCVEPVNGETNTENNCSVGVPFVVDEKIVIPPIIFLLLSEDEG